MSRGYFITFEGGEGTGKSTQIRRLAENLRNGGYEVVVTREPGGSPGSEAIRHVLLSGAAEAYGPEIEALLFAAARSDHVEQIIRPALSRGAVVLCDRFADSTLVYQGVTGNLDEAFIQRLQEIATDGCRPDLTFILDLDPKEGLRRARERSGEADPDRFEKEDLSIHEQRRQAFLRLAKKDKKRYRIIDATASREQIGNEIAFEVTALIAETGGLRMKEFATND